MNGRDAMRFALCDLQTGKCSVRQIPAVLMAQVGPFDSLRRGCPAIKTKPGLIKVLFYPHGAADDIH
jgi:hypothetical protein